MPTARQVIIARMDCELSSSDMLTVECRRATNGAGTVVAVRALCIAERLSSKRLSRRKGCAHHRGCIGWLTDGARTESKHRSK